MTNLSSGPGQKVAVLFPIYEDREAVVKLLSELGSQLPNNYIVVGIEDGSLQRSMNLTDFEASGLHGRYLTLSRNLGHQRAIAAGLTYIRNNLNVDAVITMDSDGEDLPSDIEQLVRHLDDKNYDVIAASRLSRVESIRFKLFYIVYKNLFRSLTGRSVDFGNFMAMNQRALERLTVMNEVWIHVAASVLLSKLRVKRVPLARGHRYAGRSKMNFPGLVLHGMRAIMVFAEDVLVRVGLACTLLMGAAILAMGTAVFLKIIGMASPGWFSSALGILFLILMQTGFLILMLLLVLGSSRNRPPKQTLNIDHLFLNVQEF